MQKENEDHWLFSIRSLPMMFDKLTKLGCVHQTTLLFHLQRAALQVDPEITESVLAKLSDAVIQSCLKISVNPQTASVTFMIKDDMRSENDFMNALLSHTGCNTFIASKNARLMKSLPEISKVTDEKADFRPEVRKAALVTNVAKNAPEKKIPKDSVNVAEQVTKLRIITKPSAQMTSAMAFLRRQGIDLIFPQSIHDKVLTCILVTIKRLKSTPHRGIYISLLLIQW